MDTTVRQLRSLVNVANKQQTELARVPTMLLPPEQHFLFLLARVYYSAEGDIFDGGICLGGCTSCFAQGLADRKDLPQRPMIHAYDQAVVTVPSFFQRLGIQRELGESTADLIAAYIADMPFNERVSFHCGDILQQEYPESIEIMFLDVCKTQSINLGMQKLFSRLIPGKSVLVQQDYTHPWNPYIHATMGFLDDYFEVIGPVLFSSMVYLLKKEIPLSMLEYDAYAHEPVNVLREYILMQSHRMRHPAQVTELLLAVALMYYAKGAYALCVDCLQKIQGSPCLTGELGAVTSYLCKEMGL